MPTHADEMSHLNALAFHRMSLAMTEFPQMVGLSRTQDCNRARSILQRPSQFSCDRIAEEVDEEGAFTVEEDKARRTFLQSLESLRRCTQGRQNKLMSCDNQLLRYVCISFTHCSSVIVVTVFFFFFFFGC
uniref:Uncharacterized protein n=1 Tax=Cyprinus carpio TaxID=7962 RepID=A0A8C2D2G6_CYPCA